MIELLFQFGLNNVCISFVLVVIALGVETTIKKPQLSYLLWLIVLLKLLSPPIITYPIIEVSKGFSSKTAINDQNMDRQENVATHPFKNLHHVSLSAKATLFTLEQGKRGFLLLCILGSFFFFFFSLTQVYRFNHLLKVESKVGSENLQTIARNIANQLQLKTVPTIYTTSAQLSPMVWWIGGKVRVVIPMTLLKQMEPQQFHWILAHELAHVQRKDFLVRWLEWLVCVCFWWNPLVWFARHRLRGNEEICCDNLVLSSLKPKPQTYANALLNAIEYLSSSVLRPPAIASRINNGGFLERRIRMIISKTSNRSNSNWLKVCVLFYMFTVLPLGIASGQDFNAIEKRLGKAVSEGEITLEQAQIMMDALREGKSKNLTWKENALREGKSKNLTWKKSKNEKDKNKLIIKARLKEITKQIEEAVARAKITEKEAIAQWPNLEMHTNNLKIREAFKWYVSEKKEQLPSGEKKTMNRKEKDDLKNPYKIILDVEKAIEESKLTKEEERKKLEAVKKERRSYIKTEQVSASEKARLEKFYNLAVKIKVAVKEGKLTEEEGKKKIIELKREMFPNNK